MNLPDLKGRLGQRGGDLNRIFGGENMSLTMYNMLYFLSWSKCP